jgi:nucleoporin NUP42
VASEEPGYACLDDALASHSANSIRNDLLNEKPIWPYTCYAPSKGEPNLVSGQDLSPEELRVEYVRAVKANNPAQYVGRSRQH